MKTTPEEILDKVHDIERMSACMEDSYVLKRTAIRAMDQYYSIRIKEELEKFKEWYDDYYDMPDGFTAQEPTVDIYLTNHK